MSGSRQIHSEPTDVLRGKSAVCGLNGHRLYYIISLFKVTYKSTIQVSRNFHALFYKDLREFRYLRLMRASVFSTREPMRPEFRPRSEQGLASAVNLAGPLITSSPRHPGAEHASFGGSLVAEGSSLSISSVCLTTLDLPQPNREQRAASSYQRGSRNPRPPDALAFWQRYSA